MREEIESLDNVEKVEDLKVWKLCSQITIASIHLQYKTGENRTKLKELVKKHLKSKEIDHITLEIEENSFGKNKHSIKH